VLGSDLKTSDASLVLFGGKLTQAPGAEIVGQTETFEGVDLGGAFGWAAKGVLLNPGGFSFIGWLLQTAFCLVLALVITALMPKQLRAVQQNVGSRPWASLGWGALVFFVVGPAVLLVLVISIIGLLLVLPYLLLVFLAYFIATTGAAAFLAQKVLTGFGGKENLMLAVTIGVVGTTVISQIPVVGPLLMLVLLVFGIGAAAIGAADWRRRRREAAAAQAAAQAVAAAQYAAAGGAVAQPSVITPMVYTAPDVPVGGGSMTAVTVPQPAVPAAAAAMPDEPSAVPAGPQPPQPPQPPAEMPGEAVPEAAPADPSAEGPEPPPDAVEPTSDGGGEQPGSATT
jgi:type II secretory pathway pseudopilin PulG